MEAENRAQAFLEQLYLEMSPQLVRYAMVSLQDADAAEDLVQDVFRIACLRYEELAASSNPRGWLVNTLKYVLWNNNREKDRYIAALFKVFSMQSEEEKSKQQMEAVHNELFNDDDFLLLKRLYLERETVQEIALHDGIPLDTCKKRVRRAKRRLKKLTEK